MSLSSCFIILRQDLKNKQLIDDVKSAYKYSGYKLQNKGDPFDIVVKQKDIPQYISCGRLKYVNRNTKEIFTNIFEVEFNSMFKVLIDQYNLSPYGANNVLHVSLSVAKKMLQAINYLLEQRYDRVFQEDVLANNFVEMFGGIYTSYYNYYHEDKFQYDQEYRCQKIMMKRIKIILDVFVQAVADQQWNELKHVLVYSVY